MTQEVKTPRFLMHYRELFGDANGCGVVVSATHDKVRALLNESHSLNDKGNSLKNKGLYSEAKACWAEANAKVAEAENILETEFGGEPR